jgi:hypothetical protein
VCDRVRSRRPALIRDARLLVVALTGTLSTDVVDSGPATTLEQAMFATEDAGTAAVYGRYNAVGALGALAVTLQGLGPQGASAGVHAWLFLVLVPAGITGAVLAARWWQPGPRAAAAGGPL